MIFFSNKTSNIFSLYPENAFCFFELGLDGVFVDGSLEVDFQMVFVFRFQLYAVAFHLKIYFFEGGDSGEKKLEVVTNFCFFHCVGDSVALVGFFLLQHLNQHF